MEATHKKTLQHPSASHHAGVGSTSPNLPIQHHTVMSPVGQAPGIQGQSGVAPVTGQQHFYASVDDSMHPHILHNPPIMEMSGSHVHHNIHGSLHGSIDMTEGGSYMGHHMSSSASDLPVGDLASFVPTLGQRFGSFQEIETLLDAFARANSFMIIIMRSQRPGGHVVQATFGCYKSGSYRPNKIDTPNKRTIKTNCPFQINVRYSEKTGEYRITKVDLEHNHELDMADVRTNIVKKAPKRSAPVMLDESGDMLGSMSMQHSHGHGDMGDEKIARKKRTSKKSKHDGSADLSGVMTPNYEDQHQHHGGEYSMHHMMGDHHHPSHPGFHEQHGGSNSFLFEELGLPENIVKDVHDAMQFIGL